MHILGIETSCDETSAAVASGAGRILSCVTASSLTEHARYGGVIPEIASRAHLESVCGVLDLALKKAGLKPKDISAVAVTQGPGLIGSLLVGICFAKGLSLGWKLPILGINHLKAHLYAAFINRKIEFPFVGLVVSGGHTSLYKVDGFFKEKILAQTRDDAAGEAFDKVAKILGLGYPGGPPIEQLAQTGSPSAFKFSCDCGRGLDFSFSGIKTAVLYKVGALTKLYVRLTPQTKADLCASFQRAVVEDLAVKSARAMELSGAKTLTVGGGVAFNNCLRKRLKRAADEHKFKLLIADKKYCLDNAAMVAALGARLFKPGAGQAQLRLNSLIG